MLNGNTCTKYSDNSTIIFIKLFSTEKEHVFENILFLYIYISDFFSVVCNGSFPYDIKKAINVKVGT